MTSNKIEDAKQTPEEILEKLIVAKETAVNVANDSFEFADTATIVDKANELLDRLKKESLKSLDRAYLEIVLDIVQENTWRADVDGYQGTIDFCALDKLTKALNQRLGEEE